MTIVDLYEDNYGDIYPGNHRQGLLKYNQPAEEVHSILYKGKQNLPIKSICQNKPKQTGPGHGRKGTKIFNIPKPSVTLLIIITSTPGTPQSTSVLKDNAKLWIAIYQKRL